MFQNFSEQEQESYSMEQEWSRSVKMVTQLISGACPEKQSCPEIFHCMEYTFYIQIF